MSEHDQESREFRRGLLDFPDGVPTEDDYEVAPPDVALAHLRPFLARLYGIQIDDLADAHDGICDDCGLERPLLAFAAGLKVCRACVLKRRRAEQREREFEEEETSRPSRDPAAYSPPPPRGRRRRRWPRPRRTTP